MHFQLAIQFSLGMCSLIMSVASIALRCTTMSIIFLTKLIGIVYFFRSCLRKLFKVLCLRIALSTRTLRGWMLI